MKTKAWSQPQPGSSAGHQAIRHRHKKYLKEIKIYANIMLAR
jgi:hypothetical protein